MLIEQILYVFNKPLIDPISLFLSWCLSDGTIDHAVKWHPVDGTFSKLHRDVSGCHDDARDKFEKGVVGTPKINVIDGHFLGEVDGLKDIEKKSICFAATDRINK